MPLEILSDSDVVRLLRHEVERAGGQSAWARNKKICRPNLNAMLTGRRKISGALAEKLKLLTVYVRGNILSEKDVIELLRSEVERAGGQSAWARNQQVDRPNLNKMLSGQKRVSPKVLKKLMVRTAYVRRTQ